MRYRCAMILNGALPHTPPKGYWSFRIPLFVLEYKKVAEST